MFILRAYNEITQKVVQNKYRHEVSFRDCKKVGKIKKAIEGSRHRGSLNCFWGDDVGPL